MRDSEQASPSRPVHKAALPVFVGAAVILAALAYMREGEAPAGGDDGVPHLAKVQGGAAAPSLLASWRARYGTFATPVGSSVCR